VISSSAAVYEFSTLALVAVFGTVLFSRLRTADYAIPAALLIAVFCVAQPAYAHAVSGFHAVLFAISMYAMCAAATAFVRKQDPRRTVLLGGSLAGAQLIHPMCAAASIALPFALRRSLVTEDARGTVGAIVSVLFIPALAAIGSLYLLSQNLSVLRWPISKAFPDQGSILGSIEAASGILPLLAVLALRSAPSRSIIGVLCVIAAAASLVSAIIGGQEYALQSSAAAGTLLAYLISEWPSDTKRAGLAVGAAVSNFVVAWLLAFELAGPGNV
jgi:hypothetical protein